MSRLLSLLLLAGSLVSAQSPGSGIDNYPKLITWRCTHKDGCQPKTNYLVLDALKHEIYQKTDPSKNCGTTAPPTPSICPDQSTCQQNCFMRPITNYADCGVSTNDVFLTLKQLKPDGSTASPRVYLLKEDKTEYEMMKLAGSEFSFEVDVSRLPCGMNGALYLSEMHRNGGSSGLNTAGARWGTGYCDAQCPVRVFSNGLGNVGSKGACCNEMDIWEANSRATILAPHPCSITGPYDCTGTDCGPNGVCDKAGCAFGPYKLGKRDFYGLDKYPLNTNRKITVITQFPLENGVLKEIRRMYIQGGKVIANAKSALQNVPTINYLTDTLCTTSSTSPHYARLGGTQTIGSALSRGMVLALSLWWDDAGNMNWLDSGNAGPCSATEGAPANIRRVESDPRVVFGNLKWGEIGSTFKVREWKGVVALREEL